MLNLSDHKMHRPVPPTQLNLHSVDWDYINGFTTGAPETGGRIQAKICMIVYIPNESSSAGPVKQYTSDLQVHAGQQSHKTTISAHISQMKMSRNQAWLARGRFRLLGKRTAWTSLPCPSSVPNPQQPHSSLRIPATLPRSSCCRTWAHTCCRSGRSWPARQAEWHRGSSVL